MVQKGKQRAAIPLESELDWPGFARNLKIEVRSPHANPNLVDALLDMTIENAQRGRVFDKGRKPGTGSPIRKAVARLLESDAAMKNATIWNRIKAKPPKGYTFLENAQGKYIEGPSGVYDMKHGRFCNVASEERGKLKKK